MTYLISHTAPSPFRSRNRTEGNFASAPEANGMEPLAEIQNSIHFFMFIPFQLEHSKYTKSFYTLKARIYPTYNTCTLVFILSDGPK